MCECSQVASSERAQRRAVVAQAHKDRATAKQQEHKHRKGVTNGDNFDEGNDIVTTHWMASTMTDDCAPLRHHAAGSSPDSRVGLENFAGGGGPGGNPGGTELLQAARLSAEGPPSRALGGSHDFHSRSRAGNDDLQGCSDREIFQGEYTGPESEEGSETRDELFDGHCTRPESEDESESAEGGEGNLRDHSAGLSRFEQQMEGTTADDREEQHEMEQSMNPLVAERGSGDATGGGSSSNGGGSRSSSLQADSSSLQSAIIQYHELAEKATRQVLQQREARAVEEARARGPMAPPGDTIVREDTQEPSHLSQGNGIYERATQQSPPRASEENEIFDQQTQEQQSPKRPHWKKLQKPEDDNQQHQQEICGPLDPSEALLDAQENNDDGVSHSDRSDRANDDESASEYGRSGRAGGRGGGDRTSVDATDSSDPIGPSSFDRSDIQATSTPAAAAAATAGPVNCPNEVEEGRAGSSRVSPRSSEAGRNGRDGDLEVMEGAENVDGGEDENLPEEDLAVMRDQPEREAIFREKVGDGFLTITKYYMTASSAIKGVETEQKKMLQGESDIKAGLTKFSLRVREATDALQTQLLAALRGEPGGAEEETPLAADLEQRDRVYTGMIGERHGREPTGQRLREASAASAYSMKPATIVNQGKRRTALSRSPRRATSGASAAGGGGSPLAGTTKVNSSIMSQDKFNFRQPSGGAEFEDRIDRASRPSSPSGFETFTNRIPSRQELAHSAAGQSDCGSATTSDTMNGMGSTNGTDVEEAGLERARPHHAAAARGRNGGGGGSSSSGILRPSFFKRPRLDTGPQLAPTHEAGTTVGAGWSPTAL